MARQLKPAEPAEVRRELAAGEAGDKRLLVKHFLALLQHRAPGGSVEVRVPPYAAVQVIEGVRHTRGTPPAVVETDPDTWIALSLGELSWTDAVASGAVKASGERTDLSALLPLRNPEGAYTQDPNIPKDA